MESYADDTTTPFMRIPIAVYVPETGTVTNVGVGVYPHVDGRRILTTSEAYTKQMKLVGKLVNTMTENGRYTCYMSMSIHSTMRARMDIRDDITFDAKKIGPFAQPTRLEISNPATNTVTTRSYPKAAITMYAEPDPVGDILTADEVVHAIAFTPTPVTAKLTVEKSTHIPDFDPTQEMIDTVLEPWFVDILVNQNPYFHENDIGKVEQSLSSLLYDDL